jgi:hypothetical protein
MKANEMTDLYLDTLLAGARKDRAVPSDALMARVLADAVAAQPNPLMRPQATHGASGR